MISANYIQVKGMECKSCERGVIKLKNKNGDEYMAVICPRCLGNFEGTGQIGPMYPTYPIDCPSWPPEPWTINPNGTQVTHPSVLQGHNINLGSFVGPYEPNHMCTGIGIGEDHRCVPESRNVKN